MQNAKEIAAAKDDVAIGIILIDYQTRIEKTKSAYDMDTLENA